MKKFRSRLAIALMLMMVFVASFELVGVFAEDEVQGTEPAVAEETAEPAVTEEAAEPAVTEEPAEAADLAEPAPEVINDSAEANDLTEPEPGDPENPAPEINGLTALSSCNSVYLRWTSPVTEGVTYAVTANGVTKPVTVYPNGSYLECKVTGLDANINCFTGLYPSYTFVVTANKNGKSVTASVIGAPVRTIAYKIRIKTSGTLKSHNSIKGKVKVKKGQYVYAYGFGCGGKYLFKDPKGSLYFCNFTRTSKRSAVYSKSANYTDEEATLFVNDAGLVSKNGYLVWVNTYTQHIYLFVKDYSTGRWTLNHPDKVSAECASGKASSPSPTSAAMFGRQTICKKIKTRHGIPFWSCYSDINAIHAKKKSWKMGAPASNGCVRNLKENAQKIYNHAAKKKTKVYLY